VRYRIGSTALVNILHAYARCCANRLIRWPFFTDQQRLIETEILFQRFAKLMGKLRCAVVEESNFAVTGCQAFDAGQMNGLAQFFSLPSKRRMSCVSIPRRIV